MLEALRPTEDPDWVLSHEGYNLLTESAVESRLAFGGQAVQVACALRASGHSGRR